MITILKFRVSEEIRGWKKMVNQVKSKEEIEEVALAFASKA